MTQTHRTIPQAKSYGPLGSLPLIDREKPIQSFLKLADVYGPIYQFQYPGKQSTFVSGYNLVKELSDESRFDKKVGPALQKVRAFGGDGLFTSETNEANWKKAHNILLPSFSQQAMKGYHDKMTDLAVQLVQKWARLNPNETADVPEDMTRLTLDTIGLCGFNYRFNSFYRETNHWFVDSMVRALDESMNQLQRLGIQDKLMVKAKRQFDQDIHDMFSLVDQLIAERKAAGDQGEDDLLAHMLKGKDPETGEQLSDENIRFQIITFLIAGHETTSGMLSFAIYYLMKNPDKLQKAYEEVDEVFGDQGVPSYKQVKQLKYVRNVLNESLRLWPTAPAFALYAKDDTTLGDDYHLEKGQTAVILTPALHRDQSVWGDDVESFKPERFENPQDIPQHAFKPFGNGQRACIGQQFAMHEATLVLGMLLQNFEFIDHADYELEIKESLTLKPDGMTIQVKQRKPLNLTRATDEHNAEATAPEQAVRPGHGTPLLVLHGSNLGTAKGMAREIAETGSQQGYKVNVAALDEYAGHLPTEGAVLIVSASYNGHPPDNAQRFVEWLEHANNGDASGVHYSVFGCGDRNWASTYQAVPNFIDQELETKGATRIAPRGEGDASDDMEGHYEEWERQVWQDLATAFNIDETATSNGNDHSLTIEFVNGMTATPLARNHEAFQATIVDNHELLSPSCGRSTRHLEFQLPTGVSYSEGDHLGVIPQNSEQLVHRVASRFGLQLDHSLKINGTSGRSVHLPLDQPVTVRDLLSNYVELQEPVTRAQLRELAAHTTCPPHKVELEALLEDETYKKEVLQKRLTMLELIEHYMACEIPFERFIALLPPLKARYYSISSSPSLQEGRPSVTVSVVQGEAWSGFGDYAGVASNYLASLEEGDKVACFVSTPASQFKLPESADTPMIWVGPGTGVAPYRGFIQARSHLKDNGHKLAEAHLYFGCRHPEEDFLYRDELEQAHEEGLIHLHTAFSREGHEKTYVQHLMAEDAEDLLSMLKNGAKLYVCGDGSQMAPAVESTLIESYKRMESVSQEDAEKWLNHLQSTGQYAKDVWAG
ncbi:NADPH--cytochrome P450 reductase [Pontibacillus halophilus JSM 076056 = DSM 19796]|uniref:Bifunctional cytochrome P450/NADPH--P450 reductase n=1 Tax=Pontibacillus halophilus JSM 076056 = DSM 19796 TaxID=1385510 RepID=A0A0A5I4I0_9BACI|nr:cytochrome P450 [Pontibacillus halophilus]KGX90732.1 NADPH--cytochrome P450 reductase [Pontibacillus halophilus JSM 076056 = DSM 19796]